MKKYLLSSFFILFINSVFSQSLSGNYTIGGVNPDYTTINSAAIDLNLNGVSGPTVFNIRQGTYNETIKIANILGTSLTNTITFQSELLDSNSVIIEHYGTNPNPDIIKIENSSFINIKHLTIRLLGQSRGIKVWNYSTHNNFTNCVFQGDFSNSNKTGILFQGVHLDSNSITNNKFVNSEINYDGANTFIPSSGLIIKNNTFEGGARDLIKIEYIENVVIENNIINGYIINPLTLSYCGKNIIINNNKLYNYGTYSRGIIIEYSNGTINNPIRLFNNFISSQGGCLSLKYSSNVNVIHNNFNAYRTNSASVINIGVNLINNNFYNNIYSCNSTSGGTNYTFSTTPDTTNFHSDFNSFYTLNSQTALRYNYGTNPISFLQWKQQTGQDLNSFFGAPNYINDSTDLHIDNNMLINNQGTSTYTKLVDIDGDNRVINQPPDIGADEFDVDYSTFSDLELKKVIAPDTNFCNNIDSLIIQVNNNSIFPIDSFYIKTSLFNNVLDSTFYTINIPQNDSVKIPLNHFNFAPNTLYNFDFEIIYIQDNLIGNNKKAISFYNLENIEILESSSQPCNSSKELYIKQTYPTSLLWSTGETSSKISPPSGTATYSISETNKGCTVSDTITIN